jgi:hypothetical protein
MTILAAPRHLIVDRALRLAKVWCAGQVIDDRPALAHAARVAVTLGRHVPDVEPDLVAAVLLHDAPYFAPDCVDLDGVLEIGFSPQVRRIVRALEADHAALDHPNPPVHVDDRPVLLAATADQIVALTSLAWRARRSGDVDAFFTARPMLLQLLPHFHACQEAGVGLVPKTMSDELGAALDLMDRITAPARAAAAQ